jgi:hypothetical protein
MTKNIFSRLGKRWTITECLNLQREFELLEMSIDEIAIVHKRTPNAIMFKLDEEGLADYNVLYSNYHGLNQHMCVTKHFDYDSDSDFESESESESETESDLDSDCDVYIDVDSIKEDLSLREQVAKLQKQVETLTEFVMKQKTVKSSFSFLS